MNHASGLRSNTLCGVRNVELPKKDVCLPVLTDQPLSISVIDCNQCRKKLGLEPVENDAM